MTQEMQIMTIEDVRAYVDENGIVQLNAEDVARGLGFIQLQNKNGKEYTSVRYERINAWLAQWGFPHRVGEKDFIPENMFYRLAMKATNEAAQKFQAKVADKILPAIRKNGVYMTAKAAEKILYNPDFIIGLAQQIKDANAKIAELETQAAIDKPKADYYDNVLTSNETMPITYIAKSYGMGGSSFNDLLAKYKVQYKVDGRWILYCKYANKGYTIPVTKTLRNGLVVTHTEWTHKGWDFIYHTLKSHGIVPTREQSEVQGSLFVEAAV